MNLEKIIIHGFKSCADKVEIPLKDGFTAIIGPNGCGKSNVAEAIRWTLGEQSAKSLRGKSMQDVIFAGTDKRRSMSYCEVTLVFNNENHKIFKELPFDEVTITRKLDRSGLSEYYINNTRCRMRDIINLLHDTGIGKEGYSIIGQGRIDEILSAKPEDRRNIFEEAAGISKFRAQRTEAERKLEKTSDNLNIANEVIAEIQRQLTPLRRQAETANKYFELKDALKKQEVNLYIYNYENNASIKQKVEDRLLSSRGELSSKEAAERGCSIEYDKTLSEIADTDKIYSENHAELLNLKVDAAKIEGEENVVKERVNNLQNAKKRIEEDLKSVDATLVISDNLIKAAETKKEEAFAEYLIKNKEFEIADARFKSISRTIEGQESDLESKNTAYVRAIEELGALKNNQASFVAEKGINEERAKILLKTLNENKAQLDAEQTNLVIYDNNVKNSKEEQRSLMSEYNETLSNKMESAEAVKGLGEDLSSLNGKLAHLEGVYDLALQVKNDYAGYQESVQRLMREAKNDPILKSRILGTLAGVLVVPTEYEAAIECALGASVQNVLVESERDAAQIITYLKQKDIGRVTFRPRTSCTLRTLTGLNRGILSEDGCFGTAADLVSCEEDFEVFKQSYLGTTVIVRNMAVAEMLFKKYNRDVRIVTLEGEIYNRGGEITGGSRKSGKVSLLAQDNKIEETKQALTRLRGNIAKVKQQQEEHQQNIAECEQNIARLAERIGELRIAITLNEDKGKNSFEIVQNLEKNVSSGAIEYESVRTQIKELQEKLSSIDDLEKEVQGKQSEYDALLVESKSKKTDNTSERESLNTKVLELRVALATLKSAIDTHDAEIARLKRDQENTAEEKLDFIAELKTVESQLESIKSAPEKTSFSAEDLKRIKELEESILGLDNRKAELNEKLVKLNAEKTRLFEERTAINEKIMRDENTLSRIDDENFALQEHILEEYDLTYGTSLEFKDAEFSAYGAKTEITDLKRSIAKLGDVNLLAVQDLAESEKRLFDCTSQRDDIQAAYDDINKIIEELTTEMTQKFTTAFEKIQINFTDVFAKLFGGGKGELRLDTSETQDTLEAGIEIFAQPPGKSLKHISLLSGGERALTAISILFAILKLKPMPFCVLDEIEAALDDSNANLFAEFLKSFSDFTQFIVITHRKPTMSHADSIFGVTMEERGITKFVSIEFEEAVKHAVESEGGAA